MMADLSSSPTDQSNLQSDAQSGGQSNSQTGSVSRNQSPASLSQNNGSDSAGTLQNPASDPLVTEKTSPEDLDLQWNRWKCQVCGYTYEGSSRLTVCPRCGNDDPDKFSDAG